MINIPTNTPLVDSLRIRVKMTKVKILDRRLVDDYVAYYPTMDLLDDVVCKAPPYVRVINGITYRFYVKAYITPKKVSELYLVLQLSAKMLKKKYFQGLSGSNINDVYNDIMSFRIFHFPISTLLDGLVSDIDFCINNYITIKSFDVARRALKSSLLPSKESIVWFPNKEGNKGVEFNKRDKATNTTPHCIIYHKGAELLSQKTVTFYNAYLSPISSGVLDKLFRFEFTVRNAKHKEYLKKKGFLKSSLKTLSDLFKLPLTERMAICKSGIPHYTEGRVKLATDGLNPTDIAIQYYMQNLIELGFDTERLLGFTHLVDDPSSRSRIKSRFKKILNGFTSVNENVNALLRQNNEASMFLKSIGFNN